MITDLKQYRVEYKAFDGSESMVDVTPWGGSDGAEIYIDSCGEVDRFALDRNDYVALRQAWEAAFGGATQAQDHVRKALADLVAAIDASSSCRDVAMYAQIYSEYCSRLEAARVALREE
ncbi:hypothetical protein AYO40_03530 [Planctomycetaceae bacterium SCGC AG-212-D15]|nr:hypothetical protein AYO40_03530 [Planctomycetaceae bacterium SCGC AG-212-D15]